MDETVQIQWKGRGRRLLGKADGLSQDYDWPACDAIVAVARADAPKVMLLARAGSMACTNPADAAVLEKETDAMTAPESDTDAALREALVLAPGEDSTAAARDVFAGADMPAGSDTPVTGDTSNMPDATDEPERRRSARRRAPGL